MPLLRSRCAYLWPEPDVDAFQNNWHIDEYPYEMLRLNIPLQTSPEHELHIKGKDFLGNSFNLTKHLEVGKVYLWNTNIPHTIGYKKEAPLDLPRIHLVLGLATYFDYNKEYLSFPLTNVVESLYLCGSSQITYNSSAAAANVSASLTWEEQ
jgi:hypothetical protein